LISCTSNRFFSPNAGTGSGTHPVS
jgi:hypothetical protein